MYDTSPGAVEAVRVMMQQSAGAVPAGLPVSTVAMTDEYDPVALWMRVHATPFYDRDVHGAAAPPPPLPPAPNPGAGTWGWGPSAGNR